MRTKFPVVRVPATRSQDRSSRLDRGDILESQDLAIRTGLENDVSILLWLEVAGHHAHHIRAPHIFECLRPAARLAELFFFGRDVHAVITRRTEEVDERQVVGAHGVEIGNEPNDIAEGLPPARQSGTVIGGFSTCKRNGDAMVIDFAPRFEY